MSGKKHTILYLTRGGPLYGAQRQLFYLLRGLDRDRFTPLVLCAEEGPFLQELARLQVDCRLWRRVDWRKLKHIFSRYREATRLSRLVRDAGVSLVHSSDFQFSNYMLRSARGAGIPSVLHVRAPIDRRTARKYHCADATAIVAISRRVERRLAQQAGLPREKIVLIHDAVDETLFQPRDLGGNAGILRRQYDVGDAVLVGLVGRVEEAKEQLGFVQIAGEVTKTTDKVAFFIVGQIRDRSYHARIMHQIEASGLAGSVFFTGHREDMPQVLASLDVLVSLSGGSVRYEAMMCGVPVVCAWSRRPEESDCIRHNDTGFLVPERDIGAVSRVLLDVVADEPLRRRVGRNARAWAQAHLTDAALVANTQELYECLLNRGEPGQSNDTISVAATAPAAASPEKEPD